jgi:hypothetical protein
LLVVGVAAVGLLLFLPNIGLKVFWNVLIPVAPITVVLLPGLWRNICPMGTLSLLPRRLGISRDFMMPRAWVGWMAVASLAGLFLIVPARHVMLNFNGPVTAGMILLASLAAFLAGMVFKGRSGWCASLCPIHPVEKLYGSSPIMSFPNAACGLCGKCSAPCPDCTLSVTPAITGPTEVERWAGTVMIGSFAGFVWGWFQVGDHVAHVGFAEIAESYLWPFGCALISLAIYLGAQHVLQTKPSRAMLIKVFATAAVATYYWYRLPMLGGFGAHPGTGLLMDLTGVLPSWTVHISHLVTTSFLVWFLIVRPTARNAWLNRPPVAHTQPLVFTRYLPAPAPERARAA